MVNILVGGGENRYKREQFRIFMLRLLMRNWSGQKRLDLSWGCAEYCCPNPRNVQSISKRLSDF